MNSRHNSNKPAVNIDWDGTFTLFHNHPSKINIGYNRFSLKDRAYARHQINEEVKHIRSCIAFFAKYNENAVIFADEKALLASEIQNDENLIEELLKHKPSKCVIL
jgi:hypothetical protein